MNEHEHKHNWFIYRLYLNGNLRNANQVFSYKEAKSIGEKWKKKGKGYFYSISCG